MTTDRETKRQILLAVNLTDVELMLDTLYKNPKTYKIAKQVAREWNRLHDLPVKTDPDKAV